VREWTKRNRRNFLTLDDLIPFIERVRGISGTPVTHVHELEYRRVLLMKNPCYYLKKLSPKELEEILETEPVTISGVNTWLFKRYEIYRELVAMLRRGEVPCNLRFQR
ncbi:MAG: pyrimidine dimer DNA glycosylase/endonuclease V, partial [Fervidicoccaceae archaeon]